MKHFLLATVAALALPTAANAATITINHVLNPANISTNISQELLASPFTLGVGDTLDMTITFTGGQTISLIGDTAIWPLSLTTGGSATLQTSGTLEFLGASANIVSGLIPISQENRYIHVGNYYDASDYRTDSAAISFNGLRQILTVTASDIDTPREYNSISIYTDGRVSFAAVPEPASWAMMLAGFGLIGGAVRRRQQTVKVSYA